MHLGLGQRNTAMCVAVDFFQSDISVASGTDQQRIAEAEQTKRPDAVQTIRPLVALQLPRVATEYLLRIILFVQHIAQLGIVPDFDQIGGGIDPQVQEGRQQHGIDEDAPE